MWQVGQELLLQCGHLPLMLHDIHSVDQEPRLKIFHMDGLYHDVYKCVR